MSPQVADVIREAYGRHGSMIAGGSQRAPDAVPSAARQARAEGRRAMMQADSQTQGGASSSTSWNQADSQWNSWQWGGWQWQQQGWNWGNWSWW